MATNIIVAKFCADQTRAWTDELWQYDYGQVLVFDGIDLPVAYEVHFANQPHGVNSTTQIGNADGVTIPDQFLQSGEVVYAWVYLHACEDDGETEYMVTIPVSKRAKPTNQTPTPVQQDAITEAIAALNAAVEDADELAREWENMTATAETLPEGSAATASYSEGTLTLGIPRGDTGAQGIPGQDGEDGAPGAPGEDGFSPEITVQDITGGHRITITDATGTSTVDVMDGEDGQPGQPGQPGATGNGIASITKTGTVGLVDTYTITYTNGTTTTFTVTNGSDATVTVDDELSSTSENPVQNKVISSALSDLTDDLNHISENKADIIITSASGTVASFSDGGNYDAVGLVAEFALVQSGIGDPSPSNVRPISGWTGLDIYLSGEYTTDPTTIPISWQTEAGTVYGGYVDVIRGKVVAEWLYDDLGNYRWDNASSASSTYIRNASWTSAYKGDANKPLLVVDRFNTVSISTFNSSVGVDGYFTSVSSNGTLRLMTPQISGMTAAQVKEYVTGTKFAIKLTTPVEYDIDPTTVELLKGYNNIWTSAGGNVDVEYRADTKLYLDAHAPKVSDVKINGTSIVDANKEADIPIASGADSGVVKVNGYGLAMSNGVIITSSASLANIKAGETNYYPVVPYHQHESVFYGLAKLAGSDMSSSSNPVGTYTDDAKVKIQKMLGIYEAPWELIREDAFTNATEANHIITVDGNGNPFELTDIRIVFWTPVQDTQASKQDFGRIYLHYNKLNDGIADIFYLGTWSQNPNAPGKVACGELLQKNGMITTAIIQATSFSAEATVMATNRIGTDTNTSRFMYVPVERVYHKLTITAVLGTGKYVLYGKRKWQ